MKLIGGVSLHIDKQGGKKKLIIVTIGFLAAERNVGIPIGPCNRKMTQKKPTLAQ